MRAASAAAPGDDASVTSASVSSGVADVAVDAPRRSRCTCARNPA